MIGSPAAGLASPVLVPMSCPRYRNTLLDFGLQDWIDDVILWPPSEFPAKRGGGGGRLGLGGRLD